jgi:hypothetical protein
MKSRRKLIRTRVLTVLTLFLLAVTLTGCFDPIEAEMKAEHERLGAQLERELRQYGFAAPAAAPAAPPSQLYYPAP